MASSLPPSYPGFSAAAPPPSYPGAKQRNALGAQRELKLYSSAEERSKLDDLATLYSIVRAIDLLESSFTKDFLSQKDYSTSCYKLLQQYKTQEAACVRSRSISSIEEFLSKYGFGCSLALERIRVGAPATAVISNPGESSQSQFVVMEVVQFMLTCMDALKLAQGSGAAVDDILPLLRDVVSSLNKLPNLPANFSGKRKPMQWMLKLNSMRASELLDEDSMRQMYLDLEDSYKQLHEMLRTKG
eukprot:g4829.t1